MYIIIVGGDEVGSRLGKELLASGHEVLVIERNPEKCDHLVNELGSISLCGDACEMAVLTKAGIARAGMFIAVTHEDDDNLAACQIARQKFNVPRVIARVNSPKNEHIFAKLGIEHTVDVVGLVLEHIKEQSGISPLVHLLSLRDEGMEIVLLRVTKDLPILGKAIGDLPLDSGASSLLLREGCEPIAHNPATVLEAGDQFILLIRSNNIEPLRASATGANLGAKQ
jgi:trk system potassium uptake protein TrkA